MSEFDLKYSSEDEVPKAEREHAKELFEAAMAHLVEEGEAPDPILMDTLSRVDNERLISGLVSTTERDGSLIKYVGNSSRFIKLVREERHYRLLEDGVTMLPGGVAVNQYGDTVGKESGHKLDIEFVKRCEIDPKYVLFFRVTQPAAEPKPEHFWISDYAEARHGLKTELGEQAASAIILVSTLEEISSGGGVVGDINEDEGISVQRISSDPYDQSRALCVVARPGPKPSVWE